MGRGSTGPPGDLVYHAMEATLRTESLTVRADPKRPSKHALVEPAHSMSLAVYEDALAATRPNWRRLTS